MSETENGPGRARTGTDSFATPRGGVLTGDTPRIPAQAPVEGNANGPYAPELMAQVFDHSTITKHIHAEAKILMISPWSLLGTCLGQAAIATPYDVVIPPIVGKAASVNPLMVGVGASGSGKGISTAPVTAWPDDDPFNLDDGEQLLSDAFTPLTPGSGEGISALYRENRTVPGIDGKGKITVPVVIRRAAWISFPEVDQIAAISSRVGSTAMAEIRKAWSGEPLGTMTKVKANQLMVPAHSYRAVISVSAQPLRCGPLLAEEAGGTLQRVLWLSADDPDLELRDEAPSTLDVVPPDFRRGPLMTPGPRYFEVDPAVRLEIRKDRAEGKWKGTEDSHRNLVRLKVAAAGAVLHGSDTIGPDIWAWAGAVVEHSVRVRASVRHALDQESAQKLRDRAAAASITAVTTESLREIQAEQVAKALVNWMRKHPDKTPTTNGLKQVASRQQRALVPEAVELLREAGTITEAGATQKGTQSWRLTS